MLIGLNINNTCERRGTSIRPNINNTYERRSTSVLLIYYLFQDNKSFLFNAQSVEIIYQTSCKRKLVVSYTCIYISMATVRFAKFRTLLLFTTRYLNFVEIVRHGIK